MASQAGDAQYRPTEQVGMTPRSFGRLKRSETNNQPALPKTIKQAEPITLQATSDSDLPVSYYVAYGPGRIEAGKLVIDERHSTARSRWPWLWSPINSAPPLSHMLDGRTVTNITLVLPKSK